MILKSVVYNFVELATSCEFQVDYRAISSCQWLDSLHYQVVLKIQQDISKYVCPNMYWSEN